VWDDGTAMEVPFGTLLTEPEDRWRERVGEIQLHRLLAEEPPGFKYRFYPKKGANKG
jgi:hypothetical protein